MTKLSVNKKGRPMSGRGDYYRRYIDYEKLERLKKAAKRKKLEPKQVLDGVLDDFLATLT